MRRFLLPLGAMAIGACALTGASAGQSGMTDKQAAKYERLLAGLTPGRPVDCIDTRRRDVTLEAYGDKLAYRFGRKLVYVSQTAGGCGSIARGDTLVTRQYTGRLCRGDVARTVDLPSGMETGGCAIGAFTPYSAK